MRVATDVQVLQDFLCYYCRFYLWSLLNWNSEQNITYVWCWLTGCGYSCRIVPLLSASYCIISSFYTRIHYTQSQIDKWSVQLNRRCQQPALYQLTLYRRLQRTPQAHQYSPDWLPHYMRKHGIILIGGGHVLQNVEWVAQFRRNDEIFGPYFRWASIPYTVQIQYLRSAVCVCPPPAARSAGE